MDVRWLHEALENLDSHANYIAREDPDAARRTVKRVHKAVGLLPNNPTLGHPGRIDGTRELVVPGTRLIIPYRVMPRFNKIEILRVFHSSRKLPESW